MFSRYFMLFHSGGLSFKLKREKVVEILTYLHSCMPVCFVSECTMYDAMYDDVFYNIVNNISTVDTYVFFGSKHIVITYCWNQSLVAELEVDRLKWRFLAQFFEVTKYNSIIEKHRTGKRITSVYNLEKLAKFSRLMLSAYFTLGDQVFSDSRLSTDTAYHRFYYIAFLNVHQFVSVWYRTASAIFTLNTLENFFFLNSNFFKDRYKLNFNLLNILYNSLYFSNILKMRLKYKVLETTRVVPQNLIIYIATNLVGSDWRTYGIKHINLIINLLITSIWLKNLDIICNFIKKTLNSYFYKEHKKFFRFFFFLFTKVVWPFREFFKIKGIYFQFRGKLARGGNKRKTTLTLKRGVYSLSTKSLRITYNKWSVWTKTGSMGCILYIYYIIMLIFLQVYVLLYVYALLCLLLINIKYIINLMGIYSSINIFILYLNKYTLYGRLLLLIVLSLSGVAPLTFFFLKVHFFCFFLSKVNFFLIITLYLYVYLSTLYYLQLFNLKGADDALIELWFLLQRKGKTKTLHIFSNKFNSKRTSYEVYITIYIFWGVFVLCFGALFYSDLFCILSMLSY